MKNALAFVFWSNYGQPTHIKIEMINRTSNIRQPFVMRAWRDTINTAVFGGRSIFFQRHVCLTLNALSFLRGSLFDADCIISQVRRSLRTHWSINDAVAAAAAAAAAAAQRVLDQ
jgi:hypothetical protein